MPKVDDGWGGIDGELDLSALDAAKSALDELFLLARHYRDGRTFMELMHFVARFRRYSAFNAMLVHIQMPGARYVLPAKRWAKEYGRLPKRSAQPLVMLQPMSPIMFAFDVGQTEGRRLPDGFDDPFSVKGQLDPSCMTMTMSNAQRDGVNVEMRSLGNTLGGYVRNADSADHVIGFGLVQREERTLRIDNADVPVFAEIVLNANLDDKINYATLTHELGHLYCGHVGTPNPRWWPDRRGLSHSTREFEAESVSFLVCQRAGLETPAAEYLNGYLAEHGEVPSISLDVVFKSAQRIEAMRVKRLPARTD